MAKRKKPVSLAPISIAKSALVKFEGAGYRKSIGPTPERLLKARGSARVEYRYEAIEISDGDTFAQVSVPLAHVRISDGPLAVLRDKHLLAPGDKPLNRTLAAAALRYRGQWEQSGAGQLKGADPTRESCGGSGSFGLFASEAQSTAFAVYSAARTAIPVYFRETVDAIVLHDREPADIGRKTSAYRCRNRSQAVAISDLRRGLTALARHFGLLPAEEIEGASA